MTERELGVNEGWEEMEMTESAHAGQVYMKKIKWGAEEIKWKRLREENQQKTYWTQDLNKNNKEIKTDMYPTKHPNYNDKLSRS